MQAQGIVGIALMSSNRSSFVIGERISLVIFALCEDQQVYTPIVLAQTHHPKPPKTCTRPNMSRIYEATLADIARSIWRSVKPGQQGGSVDGSSLIRLMRAALRDTIRGEAMDGNPLANTPNVKSQF